MSSFLDLYLGSGENFFFSDSQKNLFGIQKKALEHYFQLSTKITLRAFENYTQK